MFSVCSVVSFCNGLNLSYSKHDSNGKHCSFRTVLPFPLVADLVHLRSQATPCSNWPQVGGLLRRCAPCNDSGRDIVSEAPVSPATPAPPATSEAWWSEPWGGGVKRGEAKLGKAISNPTLSLRAKRMSRAKRGESNLLAAWGLLRRYAPRNDTSSEIGSGAREAYPSPSAVHRPRSTVTLCGRPLWQLIQRICSRNLDDSAFLDYDDAYWGDGRGLLLSLRKRR